MVEPGVLVAESSHLLRGTPFEAALALACLVLLPLLIAATWRDIKAVLPRPSRRELWQLAFVLIAALVLRVHPAMDPFQYKVIFDEWDYLEGGRSMLLRQRVQICSWGSLDSCTVWGSSINSKPGYAVLLAMAFSLGGLSETAAMALTLILSVAAVLVAWVLASLLFPRSRHGPLIAAVFLAVLPLHVRLSTTVVPDPISLTVGGLVLIAALVAARRPSRPTAYLLAVLFATSVSIRYENIFLLVPLVYLFRERPLPWSAVVLGLAISGTFHAAWQLSDADKEFPIQLGPEFLIPSLRGSARLWLGIDHHPLLLSALVLIGLWLPLSRETRNLLLAWLLPFILLFAFHRLPLDSTGQERHMLQGYLPFVLLATGGLAALEVELGRERDRLVALVVLVMMVSSLKIATSCPGLRCTVPGARELSFGLAHRELRPECLIAAPTPFFVSWAWGRRAIYFEMIEDVSSLVGRGECVLLHENFFCDPNKEVYSIYKRMPPVCAEYRNRFEMRTIAEDLDGAYPIRLHELSLKEG